MNRNNQYYQQNGFSNAFRGQSQQQMSNQMNGFYNFEQAYQQPQNIIEKQDYTNKGNMIHNNLGQNLLSEHVVEYKLRLNSIDRNTNKCPSIFKQILIFDELNGLFRNLERVKYISIDSLMLPRSFAIDLTKIYIPDSAFDSSKNLVNKSEIISDIYPANSNYTQNFNITGANIDGNLTWNNVVGTSGYFTGTILSTITNLTGTITGTMCVTSYNSGLDKYMGTFVGTVNGVPETISGTFKNADIFAGHITGIFDGVLSYSASSLPSNLTSSYAYKHPYVHVKIEEMSTDKNMGTSTATSNNTYTFKYDGILGNDMTIWKPMHSNTKIYPSSYLGNLSRLNITILDETGQELQLTDLEGNRLVNNPLNLLNPNISSHYKGDYLQFVQSFGGTYSVSQTNISTQVNIGLTVGVVQNELNTQTNY